MEATVEVARGGQLTIPKPIRNQLGIGEGTKYSLHAYGGVLVLTPRHGRASAALGQIRKRLKTRGVTLEEMLAELRQMRESTDE